MVHSSLLALAQAARRAAPRPRKAAIELTEAAMERVKTLLELRHKVSGSPTPYPPLYILSLCILLTARPPPCRSFSGWA